MEREGKSEDNCRSRGGKMIEGEEERIKFNKHGRSSQSLHQTDKKKQ